MARPHLTVAALIERDQHYLLVEEKIDGKSVYNQPAGHVERGESIITAIKREVLEETCRLFEPQSVLGIYQFKYFVRFCFIGQVSEPLPDCQLDSEITATHWLSWEQIQGLPLRSPMVQQCIADYRRGQHYPLSLLRSPNQ